MTGTILDDDGTGGPGESNLFPAYVQIGRIVNVNVSDWTVDVVSTLYDQRWFDIQVMSPYLHVANGEGVYVVPEVGAMCYVCKPSDGLMSQRFVLGYMSPPDERTYDDGEGNVSEAGGFRSSRQTFNPGDIIMRGRDENFVILRRGGVVQIGSNPLAQRLYVPIGNIIRDVCEGYRLETAGGGMEWKSGRMEEDDRGRRLTSFTLRSKTNAKEPEHAVVLRTGSHSDNEALRLSLAVKADGQSGSLPVVEMTMDKDGNVTWKVVKDFVKEVLGKLEVSVTEALNLSCEDIAKISATNGIQFLTEGDVTVSADGNVTVSAGNDITLIAGKTVIKSDCFLGDGPRQQTPLGNNLKFFLDRLLIVLGTNAGFTAGPGQPIVLSNVNILRPMLKNILSNKVRNA